MNKENILKFYSNKNLMLNQKSNRNGTTVPNIDRQLSSKRITKFGNVNSVIKLDKVVICLLLLLMSVRTLEARYISYKNFETFCR